MIRLGMIGCGIMAGSFLRGLNALSDRMTVTALADTNAANLAKAAEAAPDAKAVTDYREMFDACDAVLIALPHDLHHRVTLDCIEAGKHVLLEKPMAITEQQCLDLVAADAASDCVLFVGYVMRYDDLWTRMGEMIRQREYGDVFQVSIWTEQYTDRYRAWGGDRERIGGGQLFSHGCHYIDLLLHWMGRPIEGTHVGTNFGTPWMQLEGTSNVSMRFESGALGYHMGTWGARGSRLGYSVHAHYTEGMLELNHQDRAIYLHRDPSGGDLPALDTLSGAEVQGPNTAVVARGSAGSKATMEEMTAFLDCVETGKEPITHARMALQSLRVIWRLYDAEERKTVADLRGLGLDEFSDQPDPMLVDSDWG